MALLLLLNYALVSLALVAATTTTPTLRYVTRFPITKPAFIATVPHNNININSTSSTATPRHDLIVSAFGASMIGPSPDAVYTVPDVGHAMRTGRFDTKRVGGEIIWPNEVTAVDGQLVAAGGFLVPGKRGHISTLDLEALDSPSAAKWKPIVAPSNGFYHRVEKVNVLGKSLGAQGERMVSCLGWKAVFGSSGGQLEFLEPQPNGQYKAQKIADGCDVFFTTADFNNDGIPEFVVPAFFGQTLRLIWTEHPDGDYSQSEYVRQRVIDGDMGAPFDVQMVDLDGDGRQEILATNHQPATDKVKSGVFAYKVTAPPPPSMVMQGQQSAKQTTATATTTFMEQLQFQRVDLSRNFTADNSFMSAAPGSARAFWPSAVAANHPNSRPLIAVSGDGSNHANLLTPDLSRPANELAYHQHTIHDCKGIVGMLLTEDVDGDGWTDVLIPCFGANYVAVYTFAPE